MRHGFSIIHRANTKPHAPVTRILTRAALFRCRKLGLSPAAASARLFKLEATLGVRLFERTTRHLRLTDEGRTCLGHYQRALQALDDAHAALQAGKSAVRGKLRISATSDFGRHVLKSWLDQFSKLYPDVRFALMLSDSLTNMLQDDIDLAIRFGLPPRQLVCGAPAGAESARVVRIAALSCKTHQRNRYMAPRVRVLLDFLIKRFAEASGELDEYLT
jgi:DNA-binding transcriptional LysR family regulator